MATSKLMSPINIYFENITAPGAISVFTAKIKRQVFTVNTDASGNAEVNVNYVRVLACTALGEAAYLQTRKSASAGSENTVINVKDKDFVDKANISIALLITYLEY